MQSQYSCNIKENNNTKLLSIHIRKIQYTTDNKTILLTETIIDRAESDISAKKIWVL